MLQATIYADRSAFDDLSDAERGRRPTTSLAGPALARLVTMGRTWLACPQDVVLDDRLLNDIGLSRADVQALGL